jgi:hypothetical protein
VPPFVQPEEANTPLPRHNN